MKLMIDLIMVTLCAVAAVLLAGRGVTTGFIGAGIGMVVAEMFRRLYQRGVFRSYLGWILPRNSRVRAKASSVLG